ncbi:hypothetical protein NFI96_005971 [Prochilodus magdalenae]|nr:hypothetical protein NFI96_005971 [Prochilodus magdalenae]
MAVTSSRRELWEMESGKIYTCRCHSGTPYLPLSLQFHSSNSSFYWTVETVSIMATSDHQKPSQEGVSAQVHFHWHGGSAELWRLHHGVSYLFSEAEGSCAEAQKFCLQKHSEVATMTNANKDWIASQAEGRKLWMNMFSRGVSERVCECRVYQCVGWYSFGKNEDLLS